MAVVGMDALEMETVTHLLTIWWRNFT